MKTKILQKVGFFLLLLSLCWACDNDSEEMNGGEAFSNSLGIKIAVVDKKGNEIISQQKTVMPGVDDYWYDNSSKGLRPVDYTLDLYMDDKFVYSLTNPKEQQDWPVVKEPGANQCPWWSIVLPTYHAGKMMVKEESTRNAHTIEYHMQNESLFGDNQTHVIRFEYRPFPPKGFGFYADIYFDGRKVETYYPEVFKVHAESKDIVLDIEDKYWMEGATGWPIAIITLDK